MNTFQFLTKAQVAALSDEDAATYAAALAAYIKQFRIDNPTGIAQVTVGITTLGIIPNMVNGAPRVSIGIDPDDMDETFARGLCVGEKHDTILLAPGRADVVAKNARFANFSHMGIATTGAIDQGRFTLDVKLNIEGETYTGKKAGRKVTGTYTSTFLSITGFTYIPSAEVAGKLGRMTENAATQMFVSMMTTSNVPSASKVEVPAEELDLEEVNP